MKVVIVGGVAGGASAAARIRRLDENADIRVFERSGYISYANCGLPYYVGGIIKNRAALSLQTPESFYKRFRVDMKTNHEVQSIQPDEKTVTVKNLETGEVFTESYDKLLLSPGARPIVPPLPGIDSDRIFQLRTVEDALKLRDYIDKNKPQSAVVIGGGFIGVEVAENLTDNGIKVTIVEMLNQIMTPFDPEMAAFLHAEARAHGVTLNFGAPVERFETNEDGITVHVKGQPPLKADFAVLAIGVAPETGIAGDAGITLGIKNTIVVNDRMETSVPDIYAVGDAVQIKNSVTGNDTFIALAGPANREGRIAADNICGGDSHYKGSQGSSVIKVFDLTAAATGINENTAKRDGIAYDKVYLHPGSHAGYYPGAKPMVMKVLFEKGSNRLLGAQIIGYEGVDKRIDVLAAAIRAEMSAPDLQNLDLAYAPPYSSAKDPVNMAGYIIENVVDGNQKQFFWDEVADLPRDGSVTLVDVRTPDEYSKGCIDGFVNIPVDEIRDRLEEIPKDKPVYVTCQVGLRGYIAARILAALGYEVYNLSGGYRLYAAATKDQQLIAAQSACGIDK